MNVILNPNYILKNDKTRIILTRSDGEGISTFIHPLQAMVLSFFDTAEEYEKKIKEITEILNLHEEEIRNFTGNLIENKEKVWMGEGNSGSQYPQNVLINKPEEYKPRGYKFRDFLITEENIDLITPRFNIPVEAMIMINTLCYTDCIYCYADRSKRTDLKIPKERLFEIINEARNLKFRNFDISGGEFFLNKDWEKILEKLISSGFKPHIPTKIPISEKIIQSLSEIGQKSVQLSIDSSNPVQLQKMLNVDVDYWNKIGNTIKNLNKYNISFSVNTIITSLNCEISEIQKLISFLKTNSSFEKITIGIVNYSLYKTHEANRSTLPSYTNVLELFKLLHELYDDDSQVIISDTPINANNYHQTFDEFCTKAICTGNLHSFYILPDGKVTICEELYWHPEFIIGDLMNQSIMEMWNSERALNRYNLCRTEISSDSYCKNCDFFNDCRRSGWVCWREVIKTYGKENWDYPDPRCPYSPKPFNDIYSN